MSNQPSIQLIVGVGNPGSQYQNTRHNAGAWFVEQLFESASAPVTSFKTQKNCFAEVATINLGERQLRLAKTLVYMNDSGRVVQALARFYKLKPEEMLIAHDELDFAPGMVRLKFAGGHGGHNGLRDIKRALATEDFWRLRIGIGHPGHKDQVHGYVLGRPNTTDRQQIDESFISINRVIPLLIAGEFAAAMTQLHS